MRIRTDVKAESSRPTTTRRCGCEPGSRAARGWPRRSRRVARWRASPVASSPDYRCRAPRTIRLRGRCSCTGTRSSAGRRLGRARERARHGGARDSRCRVGRVSSRCRERPRLPRPRPRAGGGLRRGGGVRERLGRHHASRPRGAGGEAIERLYVQSLTGLGDVVRIRGAIRRGGTVLPRGDRHRRVFARRPGRGPRDRAELARCSSSITAGGSTRPRRSTREPLARRRRQVPARNRSRRCCTTSAAWSTPWATPPVSRRLAVRLSCASAPVGPIIRTSLPILAALAAIVDAQGRHDEAEGMYERALAIFERTTAQTTTKSRST